MVGILVPVSGDGYRCSRIEITLKFRESAPKSTIATNEGIRLKYFYIFQVETVSRDYCMSVERIIRLVNRVRIY